MVVEEKRGVKKGIPTAATWFIKTRLIGFFAIFIWFCLAVLLLILTGNAIISFLIPTVVLILIILYYNKKIVAEWKVSKSSKILKRSKMIVTVFVIFIIGLILFAFLGPSIFGMQFTEEKSKLISWIIRILIPALIILYVYYRFVKKE